MKAFFCFGIILQWVVALPPLLSPDTVVIDGHRLSSTRVRLQSGDQGLNEALKHLTAQADSWLSQGPWTVTGKETPPPGGTVHDYASQAPYWWPNPDTADGCPYIQKDGQRNPEVDKYQDRIAVGKMFMSSYVLSLAWYYTGDRQYAYHAVTILRTWFVDPLTAMNPNLNHAQIIPCANTGRSIGIIDFSQEYTNVIDAVAILSTGGSGWTAADNDAFQDWNQRFLEWLVSSPFGKEESQHSNNHATFANMQISAIALFTGNRTLARDVSRLATSFIDRQVRGDGYQPQEVARTRSWHYTNFNLGAFLRWAAIAKKVGVDIFKHTGEQGQSLFRAVEVIIPAAVNGASEWPFPDLEFVQYAATDNVHAAAIAGLCKAKRAVKGLQTPPGGDIFALRPAAQQLDSIVKLT